MTERFTPSARLWLVLAAIGVLNVASAVTIAFIAPPTIHSAAPASQQPTALQPVLLILPSEYRFEQRVRSVVRREMGGSDLRGVAAPGAGELTRTSSPLAASATASAASSDVPSGSMSAVVTPFGVYPGGFKGMGFIFLALCTLLVAGVLLAYLTPRRISGVGHALGFGWKNLAVLSAIGFLGYAVSLLLMFVLITLVVGIPFAAVMLLILAGATAIGFMGVSLSLGRLIRARLELPTMSPLLDIALGILVLFPLGILPIVGWPIMLAAIALGFGALLVTRGGTGESWSFSPL